VGESSHRQDTAETTIGSRGNSSRLTAEGEGFEPSRGFNSPNPLSRRAH
jgi:hypothetical protein